MKTWKFHGWDERHKKVLKIMKMIKTLCGNYISLQLKLYRRWRPPTNNKQPNRDYSTSWSIFPSVNTIGKQMVYVCLLVGLGFKVCNKSCLCTILISLTPQHKHIEPFSLVGIRSDTMFFQELYVWEGCSMWGKLISVFPSMFYFALTFLFNTFCLQ